MTNTEKLNDYIVKSGYTRNYIAKAIGITRHSLYLKIRNFTEFKASEIEALCRLLCIDDPAERDAIFFAIKVD